MKILRYNITLLSLLTLLLYSCTDDLGISASQMSGEYVNFVASMGPDSIAAATRSTVAHMEIEEELWTVSTTEDEATRGSMMTQMRGEVGVSGRASSDLFFNEKYTFDGDELKTTEGVSPKRWSEISSSDNITFFAYAPYQDFKDGLFSNYDVTNATVMYTVPQKVDEQQDIIGALTTVPQSQFRETVRFTFNHLLTGIRFKVGFACTVNKIEVSGVYNQGTFSLVGNKITKAEGSTKGTYTITFDGGKSLAAGAEISSDEDILMMIPQTLPSGATVKLYYDGNSEPITADIEEKTWEAGKLITYTIHETEPPTTIYFDLAAGNILIGCTENAKEEATATNKYTGYVFKDGVKTLVTGDHNSSNIYYVYQTEEDNNGTSSLPTRESMTYDGKPWADFITNNASVANVVTAWRAAAVAANREATNNRIRVYGSNKVVNLTIDNIYSTYAERSVSRTKAGIGFNAGSNSKLTITIIGDNRVSAIHYHGGVEKNNNLIFEGTGSLTVGAASGLTTFYNNSYVGETAENDTTFIDNHWCSAIGGNDSGEGNSCGIIINSGNIYVGTTKAENCTALGAGGNDKAIITINGGTVTAVATTTGTAIGGGIGFNSSGGVGDVTINGGNIYAYNHGNRWSIPSSAIGGAGSNASSGTIGYVKIHGGYVYAYSADGTAIGGGSSKTNVGGDTEVTITGGQIIAKSGAGAGIGGGSACTGGKNNTTGTGDPKVFNGGTAIITIDDTNGTPIIRTGSIGGGSTDDPDGGKIGSADITINGGDIQAQFVMAAGAKSKPVFTMTKGTIRNSDASDPEYLHTKLLGGAVYMEDGSFKMEGGTIKNCSSKQGGAVYITDPDLTDENIPTFTMSGGTIELCSSETDGGALYLNGGNATLSGNAKIEGNIAGGGNGGGICINQGSFKIDGSATLSYNTALHDNASEHGGNGGGVYVSSSTADVDVNLLSGSIMHNTSDRNGGGIHVDMGSSSKVANIIVGGADSGPDIEHNHTILEGGGLYANGNGAAITFNNGTIQYNTVSGYVDNPDVANNGGMVTLNGGTVKHIVVTFEGNKGYIIVDGANRENTTQKIVTNTNSKLMAPTPNRAGWTFTGWNDRPDGLGNTYTNGQILNRNTDLTLYAQWELGQ